MHNDDDHDGGLSRDLKLFQDGLIARRRALSLLGLAAGSVAVGSSLWFPRSAEAAGTCVADAQSCQRLDLRCAHRIRRRAQ
jgi:hypothetical protein